MFFKKRIEEEKREGFLKDSLSRILEIMLFRKTEVLVLTYGGVNTEEVILYLEEKGVREDF